MSGSPLVDMLRREAECDENEGGFGFQLLRRAADALERAEAVIEAAKRMRVYVPALGCANDFDRALAEKEKHER